MRETWPNISGKAENQYEITSQVILEEIFFCNKFSNQTWGSNNSTTPLKEINGTFLINN